MAEAKDVIVEVDADGVALVTLNRPHKRNAVTLAMWGEIGQWTATLGGDPAVRAIVVTGAGGHFCAGADISEFAMVRATAEQSRHYEEVAEGAVHAMLDCPKPVIAAVSGFGVGGGCGLALGCDFRVGDATTQMGIPAARLGIVYSLLESRLLLSAVGLSNAKLVLYSARRFGAAEAMRIGLLDQVAEDGAVAGARRLAGELIANAPLSLAGSKEVLQLLAEGDAERHAQAIAAIVDRAIDSEDYREAARAFVEKRPPVFRGR
ncbi:MAG: enoyl-CoA hydratase/isomerase family protein [Alphaproteobacteria bacterium]|nr:enoyl-CoA hydratase/isomerase family protein [Alphaproteobacteria bacterium]